MQRTHSLIAALFAVALTASPLFAQQAEIEGSHYRVADYWWGGALADAEGKFDYCDVNISHGKAITLSYALRRDDVFVFMVYIKGADLGPGATMEVGLASDAFSADHLEARILDPDTFAVLVPGLDGMLATVKPASYLSVQLGKRNFMIPTPGGPAALDALKACFDTYSAPEGASGAEKQATP